MRHRRHKATLDRTSYQRRVLVRNLANALVRHEKIVTTPAKAKVTQSLVERLITLGKNPTLHHRRQLLQALADDLNTKKILATLSPRYQQRSGGYTRLIKIANRAGDQAEQVLVEFVM